MDFVHSALNWLTVSSIGTGLLVSAVTAIVAFVAGHCVSRWQRARATEFWAGVLGSDPVELIVNERLITGNDPDSVTGRQVGDGYYVTKGMAGAVARVFSFASKYTAPGTIIGIVGSETERKLTGRVICLGSTDNDMTHEVLRLVREHYAFDFRISPSGLELHDGTVFKASVDAATGRGTDYALVVRAHLPPSSSVREVIVIAGIHMYGTEGAAMALTDEASLVAICREVQRFRNCAFVLRVKVEQHRATMGELELGGRKVIDELGRRR